MDGKWTFRQFGQKYKDDNFAQFYAQKHDASLGKRIANYLERAMIRRSLRQLRRRQPFETVLDCPSGTGRFLPVLAEFGVSVTAMDTADAMLRQGRAYHDLFTGGVRCAAGSAFQLPLPDRSVDVVLCARLLHHFSEPEQRIAVLKEFARVARVGVVLSFFDAHSFRAWWRRRKIRRKGHLSGRHPESRRQCGWEGQAAGLILVGFSALARFHSEITAAVFLIAPG